MTQSEHAKEVLNELLQHMGIDGSVKVNEDEEQVLLDVEGPDTAIVIGRKGQTLESLQLLTNKIVGRRMGIEAAADTKPIRLDAEGYRARRMDTLEEMAHRLAEKARRSGRAVTVDNLSPHDRRVIHMALEGADGVTTRSEGEGLGRVLLIIPDA